MLLTFIPLTVRFPCDIIALTTHKQMLKLTGELLNPLTVTTLIIYPSKAKRGPCLTSTKST